MPNILSPDLLLVISTLFLVVSGFYFWESQVLKKKLKKQEQDRKIQQEETSNRMYELAILKELGDRVGYSLNIENIIDIIIGSLNQFIKFSVVSYMLLEPEKIIFKVHLEQSISRKFINEVQKRMLKSLSALLDKEFNTSQVTEIVSGAILVEDMDEPVRSYFNIPLVIADKVVGVLTVAHTKAGLYREEEMTILYKIVKQASQAVSRLQEVVRTEQGKLNAMMESMSEGVVMTDTDYRIMVANPAAKKIINFNNQGEISIFNFIDGLKGKFDIRAKLEESVKLDKVLTFKDVLIGDNFYQIFISPVKSDQIISKGEILGGVVIFHDITNEKEVEKMREDFTSMMVHELRSPLDGVKKISQLLGEDYVKEDKKSFDEFIQLIYKNSSRMLEMVNDLLDVAKLEAGKFEVNKELSEVRKVVEEKINFYKVLADDSKIGLDLFFAEDVPQKVNFDPAKISQTLNNLISNSLKFSKDGGKVFVQTFVHRKGQDINEEANKLKLKWFKTKDKYGLKNFSDALVIAVTDTGIGISEKNQKMLFNKFKQFKATAKGEKKGTGLGLIITKGIIEAHQGRVGIGSQEGGGSTFYLAIPL